MPESGICSLSGTGKAGRNVRTVTVVNSPFYRKRNRGGGNMLEQLVWSEFGDYIRDYLAGDAYGEI